MEHRLGDGTRTDREAEITKQTLEPQVKARRVCV